MAEMDGLTATRELVTRADPPKVLGVTASFGIASYPETKVKNGEDLVRKADRALYLAKESGRNRVVAISSDTPTLTVVD
mgnify:CR=1 FL=1